jgi:hypothetical protein
MGTGTGVERFDLYARRANLEHVEAVKHGFSWPGFFFSWIWAFAKGMPGLGVLLLAVDLGLAVADHLTVDGSLLGNAFGMVFFAKLLVVGATGNAWRRRSLERRAFVHVDTLEAKDSDAAAARWLEETDPA